MAATIKYGDTKWAVKDGNTLGYNDENRFKPVPFDFTRNSIGTRVDRNGLIETIGNNIPRIDFTDNTDGHLLLEPQSTNLVTYSEDFTTWTIQSGTTVTSDTTETLSPSGEYNSSKIVGNGTSGILKASVSSAGGSNTKSIYIKGTQNGQVVYLKDPNQTVNNKALTLTTEWVRYSLTETQTSDYGIWISNIPTEGIYMWGGQVEALSYPTSYIPTNGSTVTRDAETCTNAGNSTLINSTEGVLYAEIAALANDGTNRTIALNKDTNDRIQMYFNTSTNGLSIFYKAQSGATSFIMNETLTDATSFNKIAFKWKANDFALWVNGVETDTVSSGVTPTANSLNALEFEMFNNASPFYGKCKALTVYNTALTDAELTQLTS